MRVVRLPPWSEILAAGGPWALLLRSRPAGLWLLRGEAETVHGLETRLVEGARCATSAELFDEWSAALEFPEQFARDWDAFDECVSDLEWLPGTARAILVSDAERLLEHERARLPTLLDSLRIAAARLAERGVVLRLVFQAASEVDGTGLAVFREFGVADAG